MRAFGQLHPLSSCSAVFRRLSLVCSSRTARHLTCSPACRYEPGCDMPPPLRRQLDRLWQVCDGIRAARAARRSQPQPANERRNEAKECADELICATTCVRARECQLLACAISGSTGRECTEGLNSPVNSNCCDVPPDLPAYRPTYLRTALRTYLPVDLPACRLTLLRFSVTSLPATHHAIATVTVA